MTLRGHGHALPRLRRPGDRLPRRRAGRRRRAPIGRTPRVLPGMPALPRPDERHRPDPARRGTGSPALKRLTHRTAPAPTGAGPARASHQGAARASVGASRAALIAGYKPATAPMNSVATKPPAVAHAGTTASQD